MSDRTRPFTSVDAIKTCLAFLQTGVMDRENKAEMRKITTKLDELEGNSSGFIDI